MMTPEQIIKYDAEHNQEGFTAESLAQRIKEEISNENAHLVREGDTLIIFKRVQDGSCEFHCFNADTPQNLAQNVLRFLYFVKKIGFYKAFTPYKNPAVSHLMQKFLTGKYQFNITKSGDGFVAEVNL
jgi:hypothetical protein